MRQVSSGGFTLKNQPIAKQAVDFENLSAREFFTIYLGAERVMLDFDGEGAIEVTFSFIGEDHDCALDVADLKPRMRLKNIQEITRAMRQTFPENGYPE